MEKVLIMQKQLLSLHEEFRRIKKFYKESSKKFRNFYHTMNNSIKIINKGDIFNDIQFLTYSNCNAIEHFINQISIESFTHSDIHLKLKHDGNDLKNFEKNLGTKIKNLEARYKKGGNQDFYEITKLETTHLLEEISGKIYTIRTEIKDSFDIYILSLCKFGEIQNEMKAVQETNTQNYNSCSPVFEGRFNSLIKMKEFGSFTNLNDFRIAKESEKKLMGEKYESVIAQDQEQEQDQERDLNIDIDEQLQQPEIKPQVKLNRDGKSNSENDINRSNVNISMPGYSEICRDTDNNQKYNKSNSYNQNYDESFMKSNQYEKSILQTEKCNIGNPRYGNNQSDNSIGCDEHYSIKHRSDGRPDRNYYNNSNHHNNYNNSNNYPSQESDNVKQLKTPIQNSIKRNLFPSTEKASKLNNSLQHVVNSFHSSYVKSPDRCIKTPRNKVKTNDTGNKNSNIDYKQPNHHKNNSNSNSNLVYENLHRSIPPIEHNK